MGQYRFALIVCFSAFTGRASSGQTSTPEKNASRAPKPQAAHIDRYGDPIPQGAIMRLGTVRFCQGFPSALCFTADGRSLVSGGDDNCIRFWHPSSGKQRRVLRGHDNGLQCIVLSADGRWLASASLYGDVRLWDLNTGKEKRRFRGPDSAIARVALSPDGRVLASSYQDGTIHLWNAQTGEQMDKFQVGEGNSWAIAFTPDSKGFAYNYNGIRLTKLGGGNDVRLFRGDRVGTIDFAADGRTLISGGHEDGTMHVWDVATGKEQRRWGDGSTEFAWFLLAPDGKTLVYETKPDRLVHRWDIATNKAVGLPWKADWPWMYHIACSPDNKKIAAAGHRGTIAIYDAATGKRLNPLRESDGVIKQVAYSADGKLLAVRRLDHTIDVWNTATWLKAATIKPKHGPFDAMAFAPHGEKLTTAEDLVGCHWNARTGKQSGTFLDDPVKSGGIQQLAYSANGKVFALMNSDRRFILVDANTGKELRRFGDDPSHMERRYHLTPDGSRLVCATCGGNSVSVWDINTGTMVHGFGEIMGSESRLLALSPDGRLAAGPGGNVERPPGTFLSPDIVLGEVATGHERMRIRTSEGHVQDGAFSPDGRLLATTGAPGTINVWDAWTGKEITRLHGHRGRITLAFAPDGKTLASGSSDGTVLIWDVAAIPLPERQRAAKLEPDELAACWERLAGTDGGKAYGAMVKIIACPGQVEEFIKGKLLPKNGLTGARLARLIADLDADDFAARQHAYDELAALGKRAESALTRELQRPPSLEFRRRAEALLKKLAGQRESPERRRQLRAIEVLERLATPAARAILLTTATEVPEPEIAREAKSAVHRLRAHLGRNR